MNTQQSDAVKTGFAAEVAHKESFNLDANTQGKGVWAYSDTDSQFIDHGYARNDQNADLITVKDGQVSQKRPSQIFRRQPMPSGNSAQTAAPNILKPTNHIVPSKQVEGVKDAAHKTTIRNQDSRPKVAEVEKKGHRASPK